ncbi:gamma-glutamylcyclotransferase family protein [Photobacterium minamisatsumaniensis]|uniref:gamma-glutamylcyclotransferase family protein n=1 Tax=Photobacterium minamisatsumaniensis TaxID=2910233 RepID=UPI003D0EE63B
MEKVFVYGTLRKGESNHHLLVRETYIGRCQVNNGYRLYNLGDYPAIISAEPSLPITGEVYEVSDDVMAELDRLEECPVLYLRALVKTEFGQAWIYIYTRPVERFPVINHGDWCLRER